MTAFKTIGLVGMQRQESISQTLCEVIQFLKKKKLPILLEEETAEQIPDHSLPVLSKKDFPGEADLVIVVGGDGSMLKASHLVLSKNVPVLGINRGNLGFLTDISPTDFKTPIEEALQGHFTEERRFLLHTEFQDC